MADRVIRDRFEAVIGQYQAAMAQMMASTKSVGTTIDSVGMKSKGTFKSLGMDLAGIGSSGVLGAAGVAVVAAAVAKFTFDGVRSFTELAGEVRAYKNVTGESAEESSKMIAVAKALGVSTDVVSAGMFRLARSTATHADTLAADGVAVVKNARGQNDLAKTLVNVAGAYQRAGTGAAGDKIVFDAFGRSGMAMIPILKQSTSQLEQFWEAAQRHRQILSDEDLHKAFEYKVATRELGEAWSGLERQWASVTIPLLASTARFLTREAEGVGVLTHAIGNLIPGHHSAASAAHDQAEAEQSLADQMKAAKEASDGFAKALDAQYAATFSVAAAQDGFSRDLLDFINKVRTAQTAGDRWAASLDDTTATGLANRQMVQGLAKDIIDTAKAAAAAASAQGLSADQQADAVATATERQRVYLDSVLQHLGFNKDAAQRYTEVLLGIPSSIGTTARLDTSAAMTGLRSYVAATASIPRFIASTVVLNARMVTEFQGVPDSIASSGLLSARNSMNDLMNWLNGQANQLNKGVSDALSGDGSKGSQSGANSYLDAVWKARMEGVENRFHAGQATLAQYQASLDEQMAREVPWTNAWVALQQKKADAVHYWTDASSTYLHALADHQKELQDNEYAMGAISKDQYLAILQERLKGLERYSNAWTQIMQQIQQLESSALAAQIKIIQAYDQGRAFQTAFDALAGQRQMSAGWQQGLSASMSPASSSPTVVVQGGTSYNPTLNAYGSDAVSATNNANQQMRDYAALTGV